jgi:hypothetical protein
MTIRLCDLSIQSVQKIALRRVNLTCDILHH